MKTNRKVFWKKLHSIFEWFSPVILLIMIIYVSCMGWYLFSKGSLNWADFYLSLLTGVVASLVTTYICNRFISKAKDSEEKPLKLALQRDLGSLIHDVVELWQEMYIQSAEDRKELTLRELFTKETFDQIYNHLDLEGSPAVLPKRDWYTYIDSYHRKLQKNGEKILERYFSVASPEFLGDFHRMLSSNFIFGDTLNLVNTIRSFDKINHIPRPPLLTTHYFIKDEDFLDLYKLFDFYEELCVQLGTEKFTKLSDKIIIINPIEPATSIITTEKYLTKVVEYDKWVKSNPSFK